MEPGSDKMTKDKRFKEVKKERNRVDKKKSIRKKKRKGFKGNKTSRDVVTELEDDAIELEENENIMEVIDDTRTLDDEPGPSFMSSDISIMELKQGKEVEMSPQKLTRKRKRESPSILLNSSVTTPASGHKIIDSSNLTELINIASVCPSCGGKKCFEVHQDNSKKKGLCETLLLFCKLCKHTSSNIKTSSSIVDEKSTRSSA